MEVKFGDTPNVSTGGSAGTDFYDRSEDHDFVSSCCESDHNREDGATFFHFTHAENESDRDYMVDVAAYDHYNGSLSHTYNGPYEITLTDITGTERMINDFYGGTTASSDEVLNASATNKGSLAMRFQTGGHAAGYTLDRIRVRSHDIANRGDVPEIAMHQDSSSPGAKLCDIAVPDRIMEEPIRWISSLIHTYLAPDCADDVLASSSHYWIVFSGLDHADYTLAYATSGAEETDYFGSGWTIERTARKLASETGWASNTSHRLRMAITSLCGDSGSPYYTPVGSTDNVRLYGIHMGIWDGSKVVSPLGGIYSDLGSSVTWNSCASPYTC